MEILEQSVPLHRDEEGIVRVGGTRVLFEIVVRSYLQGRTPEEIVQDYPTLSLADTYGAIAYFHQHRNQVEEYLQHREDASKKIRERLEEKGIAINIDASEDHKDYLK